MYLYKLFLFTYLSRIDHELSSIKFVTYMFNQIFYGYERLDSGAASPGRRGELSDARDPQDGQVQTAMDRSGRVVVIVPCLPPLSFNPLPPHIGGRGIKREARYGTTTVCESSAGATRNKGAEGAED